MIKNIIWDFDGTLCNTYPSIVNAFKDTLKEYNIEVGNKIILDQLKITMNKAFEYFSVKYSIDIDNLVSRYLKKEKPPQNRPLYNYAKEVCEMICKNGGNNFIVTHRDRESTIEILDYYDAIHLFRRIITSDAGFKRKPDPEAFNYLIKEFDLRRKDTLAVGDRELDIRAAKNAEVISCYFNEFGFETSTNPDIIITSFNELLEIITNN
ncbi:MAG: HAD-IA family hydrolase [Asgard group archaeon]|nr:HAD-IA family hydrolase [Asgard group archaeon]